MENKKPFDWENIFCAKDFENLEDYGGPDSETIAEQANARFRSLLKEHGKKVYKLGDTVDAYFPVNRRRDFGYATHEAWLIGEKEITDETK